MVLRLLTPLPEAPQGPGSQPLLFGLCFASSSDGISRLFIQKVCQVPFSVLGKYPQTSQACVVPAPRNLHLVGAMDKQAHMKCARFPLYFQCEE